MSTTLYNTRAETNLGSVAVSLPVRHTGIAKGDTSEARAARSADEFMGRGPDFGKLIATAPNPCPRVGTLVFDENSTDNLASPGSHRRSLTLLSEGYRISRWPGSRNYGLTKFCVETPMRPGQDPWYWATFDGHGGAVCDCAVCDCAKSGLGRRSVPICCHLLAILRWERAYPGFLGIDEVDGVRSAFCPNPDTGAFRTVRVEVAK